MNLHIPQISGHQLPISLEASDRLFIVGANGSGKSALIQHLVSSNRGQPIKRISAHRQTWFPSGSIDLTPQSRKQFDRNITNQDVQDQSRWRDDYAQQRQSAVLFDLVAKENTRARLIARHVDSGNMGEAKKASAESSSLFDQLNELLGMGSLAVTLENSNDEEILARHRDGYAPFSIAQMSDGERNAAIIAATVLTVDPGTVLLIDEPERHLHRSIIEPFLSALFAHRMDCPFVISTHELALPVAKPKASVLLVRLCQWNGDKATAWDVELLEPNAGLPEELKRDILGSRKRVLFVEGNANSLDLPLYNALFPGLSVIPKGSCIDVEKAVKGMRGSQDLHHVEAFGLIDRDNRDEEKVRQLAEGGVFALDVYSVESLYFCSDAIAAVARQQAESLGRKAGEMIKLVEQNALDALEQDDLAERMAARRCEGRVRDQFLSKIPNSKSIKGNEIKVEITVDSTYEDELAHFKKLLVERKLDDLIARYPLRESDVFDVIVKVLELKNGETYKQTLVSRIKDDESLAEKLRKRIEPLARKLDYTAPTSGVDLPPNSGLIES